MFAPSQIELISARAAALAAGQKKVPFLVWPRDLEEPLNRVCKRIPNIGSYRPQGWELLDTYLVDKTGLGGEDEPVLTADQFCQKLEVNFGYAVVEEGRFHIHVGKFKRIWP